LADNATLIRKDMDINALEILSNFTLRQNKVKEQGFYCCSVIMSIWINYFKL